MLDDLQLITGLSPLQVVERIRAGGGKGKTLLVMDSETEKEMAKRVSNFVGVS